MVGLISKRHGLIIQYDIPFGPLKVPPRDWNRQCKWITDDNGRWIDDRSYPAANTEIDCKIDFDEDTHRKALFVYFPDGASFSARVRNKHQLAEMLKMVLTYDPSSLYR